MSFPAEGQYLESNDAAQRILGEDPSRVPLRNWVEHHGASLPDEATPYPYDRFPVVRAMTGEKVAAQEIYLRNGQRPDGVWIDLTALPLRDQGGAVVGVVWILRDISSRKTAQKHLELYQRNMRSMASKLLLIEERQRQILAQTLHDGLGQTLAAIKMKVTKVDRCMGTPGRRRAVCLHI